jgi:hypothetical protein
MAFIHASEREPKPQRRPWHGRKKERVSEPGRDGRLQGGQLLLPTCPVPVGPLRFINQEKGSFCGSPGAATVFLGIAPGQTSTLTTKCRAQRDGLLV